MLFFVAAAAGGGLRWLVVTWWARTWQALLAVNVTGSALLGWLVAADASAATLTVVGVALAGSLTTFSSFALDAVSQRPLAALAQVAATLSCCLGAASMAMTL
ncbi:MAG: CrcB family protein [Actinomycetota bacterium]